MDGQSNESAPPTTWQARLKGLLAGCILLVIGYWLTAHGAHAFPGRYHQPAFSYGFVAGGAILLLASVAPARLIIKMTALKRYRPYQRAADRAAPLTPAPKPK